MTRIAPAHPLAAAVTSALLVTACASATSREAATAAPVAATASAPAGMAGQPSAGLDTAVLHAEVPNFNQPRAGLFTGGQPSTAAWAVAARAGVRTVVNLRPQAELGARDEAAEVAAAGLHYQALPIAGAPEITVENARALWTQLRQAESDGGVLLHCASGNRVGALLAIGAALEGGMGAEDAIAFGRSAGLRSLEPRVREVLATPAD